MCGLFEIVYFWRRRSLPAGGEYREVSWSSPLCLLALWWWEGGPSLWTFALVMSSLLSLSLITIFYNRAHGVSVDQTPVVAAHTGMHMRSHVHQQTCFKSTHTFGHKYVQARQRYKCDLLCFFSLSLFLLHFPSSSISCIIVLCEQRIMVWCLHQGKVFVVAMLQPAVDKDPEMLLSLLL